jgi:hypothetical protein
MLLNTRGNQPFSLLELLIAPLGLLSAGRAVLLIYTISLSLAGLVIAKMIFALLTIFSAKLIDPLTPLSGIAEVAGVLVVSMALLPLILLSVVIPIKAAWNKRALNPKQFIKSCLTSLPRALPASLLLLAALFTLVGGLTALYFGLAQSSNLSALTFNYLFSLGLVLLAMIIFKPLLRLILQPFLAITRDLNVRESFSATSLYLKDNYFALSLVLISTLGGLILTNYLWNDYTLTLNNFSPTEITLYLTIIWYSLALVAVFSMMVSANSASNQMSRLKGAATPMVINTQRVQALQRDDSLADDPSLARKRRPTTALTPKDRELLFG